MAGLWCNVVPLAAQDESVRTHVKDGLPRFDPNFAERQAASAPLLSGPIPGQAPRPRLRSIPPRKAPGEQTPEPTATDESGDDVVRLPEVTVETKRLPTTQLPRLPVPSPKNDVVMEPFLSDEAKAEKLEEKHLSAFDRLLLNRYELLGSNQRRAAEAEQREQFAIAMNDLAEAIEQAGVWGTTEEEKKKLQKEYYQLLINGPK